MSGYYAAAAQCTRCVEEVGCTAKKETRIITTMKVWGVYLQRCAPVLIYV